MYVDIVALCDVYDALTTTRVYRDAIESEETIKMIKNGDCGPFKEELLQYLECLDD